MKKRIITGLIMALFFIPILMFKPLEIPFKIFIGILSIAGIIEMLATGEKKKKIPLEISLFGISITLLIFLSALFQDFQLSIFEKMLNFSLWFNFSLFFGFIGLLCFLVFNEKFDIDDFGRISLAILYVGIGTSSIVLLKNFESSLVMYLFLTTVLTDVFAYIIGIKFGKHKLSEKISPKKTWEGAIGGTLIATIITTILALNYGTIFKTNFINENGYKSVFDGIQFIYNLNFSFKILIVVAITLTLSIVGQIGDLVASKIKRFYGQKDFGSIFPGHGGMLDRFDSAFLASSVFVLIILAIEMFF